MRPKMNGRLSARSVRSRTDFVAVSDDRKCITGAHSFYSTVVLPSHIFENHQKQVEMIQRCFSNSELFRHDAYDTSEAGQNRNVRVQVAHWQNLKPPVHILLMDIV